MKVTEHAKNMAQDLLYNHKLPVHQRVLMRWVRLIMAELLPRRIREAYGLKTTKMRRGMYQLTVGFAKATYPCLPLFVRTYPKRYYMKDMRRGLQNRV